MYPAPHLSASSCELLQLICLARDTLQQALCAQKRSILTQWHHKCQQCQAINRILHLGWNELPLQVLLRQCP